MEETRTVIIFVFDDVEVLDFCGPFEVFSVTNEYSKPKPFRVKLAAEKTGPVIARNGLSVNPDYTLEDCPRPEILLIPGGLGTRRLLDNAPVIDWIRRMAGGCELVLSVCTGSILLAKAGLLDGKSATTHHLALELLAEVAPDVEVEGEKRVVDNGAIVCSAGISAGIDMSFHVLARLHGKDKALQTAEYMEYDWTPDAELSAGYA